MSETPLWKTEDIQAGKHLLHFFQQIEEKKTFLEGLTTLAVEKDWQILIFPSKKEKMKRGQEENRISYLELAPEHLTGENFSPREAAERIASRRKDLLAQSSTTLCLLVEMDRLKKGEEFILQFEEELHQLVDDKTLIICQYPLSCFPSAFLSQILLSHPFFIFEGTVCKNEKAKKEDLDGDLYQLLNRRLMDTTKRLEQVEQGLQWSRDLCLAFFEEFPHPLILSDAKGNFIDFNHSWLQFTGKTMAQEKGQGWLTGLKEEDRQKFQETFQHHLHTQRSFQIELELLHYSGTYRYLLCAGRPIWNFSGRFGGYMISCFDITQRREKEEERMKELERELFNLQHISQEKTSITARSLGVSSLKEGLPDVFAHLLNDYQNLMEETVKEKIYGKNEGLEEEKQAFVTQLGFLQASPKDLIHIHSKSLEIKCAAAPREKAMVYVSEGRILVLEIMGYLTSYYRRHCSGLEEKGSGQTPDQGGP